MRCSPQPVSIRLALDCLRSNEDDANDGVYITGTRRYGRKWRANPRRLSFSRATATWPRICGHTREQHIETHYQDNILPDSQTLVQLGSLSRLSIPPST